MLRLIHASEYENSCMKTSCMKNWVSISSQNENSLLNTGWLGHQEFKTVVGNYNGIFDLSIPLKTIFGVAEDYKKIIIGCRHELILTRAHSDDSAIMSTVQATDLDIEENVCAVLYEMYTKFQESYYGEESELALSQGHFIEYILIIVIHCSKRNDSLKNAPVDVKVEL